VSIQSDVAQTANLINQVVTQAVVRPTGSPGLTGISGFLFDIVAQEDVSLDSYITDHYVEDNSAIQDHIAIKPERFTVKGYAGEISDRLPDGVKLATSIIEKVAVLATMAPQFAEQSEQFYAQIAAGKINVGQFINTATSLYDIFVQAITTATRQQAAFNYFFAMWRARQLCTVETPWNVFTDMAIESVRGHQSDETKLISEFSVTFKKVRKASVAVSVGLSLAGRVASMASAIARGGSTAGEDLPAGANISQLWSDPEDFKFSKTQAQYV